MARNLIRRVRALAGDRESDAVIEALATIEQTGRAPEGAAGKRAAALWAEAQQRYGATDGEDLDGDDGDGGVTDAFALYLWCYVRATGKSIADLMREANP